MDLKAVGIVGAACLALTHRDCCLRSPWRLPSLPVFPKKRIEAADWRKISSERPSMVRAPPAGHTGYPPPPVHATRGVRVVEIGSDG